MAQPEMTFIKPSYRVIKRILERYMNRMLSMLAKDMISPKIQLKRKLVGMG